MSKFCSNCGGEVNSSSSFCPECGSSLSVSNSSNSKSKLWFVALVVVILLIVFSCVLLFSSSSSASSHEISFPRQGFAFNVSDDYVTNSTYNVDTVTMDVLFECDSRDFHIAMTGFADLDEVNSYISNSNTWNHLGDLNTSDGNLVHVFESRTGGGYACFIDNPSFNESAEGFGIDTYRYVYLGASDYNDVLCIVGSFYWFNNTVDAHMNSSGVSSSHSAPVVVNDSVEEDDGGWGVDGVDSDYNGYYWGEDYIEDFLAVLF